MPSKVDFAAAVRSQPQQLARVRENLIRQLAEVRLPAWVPGESLGIVAMGASHNSGHAAVAALAVAGHRAVNLVASDVVSGGGGHQPADLYLVVSESGRSPEPIEAARRLAPGRRVGLSNFADAPLSDVVDVTLSLGGIADSGIYSVGYTGTLLAYGLILEQLGTLAPDRGLMDVPTLVHSALAGFASGAAAAGQLIGAASAVDVIGRGFSFSAAAEFALMLREGLRIPAACYDTYEYLHGPVEAATPRVVVVIFGDERELDLAGTLVAAEVPVILITAAPSSVIRESGNPLLRVVRLDADLNGFSRSIIEAVFAQQVLVAAAECHGVRLGEFAYRGLGTKLADEGDGRLNPAPAAASSASA